MNPFADLIPTQKTNSAPATPDLAGNPFADLTPGYQSPTTVVASSVPEKKKSAVGEMAKSLISAPATILARPFQAAEGLVQYAQDKPKIDEFKQLSHDILAEQDDLVLQLRAARAEGRDATDIRNRIQANTEKLTQLSAGIQPTIDRRPTLFKGSDIVAATPENMGDVKKDVGRAIQTVALGTGAPLAGGAAFGLGSSLEQGNDLFSAQTAFNTVLGAGAGKIIDLVGKPLFNAAGKVVGTITPQILKDVAGKGATAITDFAARHELLGGVAKPLSEKIATGFQAVDDNAGKLFKGTGSKMKEVISSQYPGLSKENLQNRYTRIEQENFAKPTEKPDAAYRKATELYKNAKEGGTDLSKVATDSRIRHDSIIEGNKYNTTDTADSLRTDAMQTSRDLIRPALAAAEPGVQRIPISQVRETILSQIDNIPATQITDAERAMMKRRIATEYADASPAAVAHPNGFSLTDLHDNKISTSLNAKYKPLGTIADNLKAKQNKQASDAFRKLLEDNAPAELDIKAFNKKLQEKFQLADYLEALHGKKVPMGLVSKAIDLFGKVAGASAGSSVAGGLGGVAGYHLGGVFFDAFEHLPNPLKAKYLNSIEKATPEVFQAFKDYLGKQEMERILRRKLPAPTTIFQGPTQGGKPYTPNPLFSTTPIVETKQVRQ